MYEELAYLQNPVVLARLATRDRAPAMSVWNTHVRLRTDIVVDLEVRDQKPARIALRYAGGTPIAEIDQQGVWTDAQALNPEFGTLLATAVDRMLQGHRVAGICLKSRPLIAAPLWADGPRSDVGALDAFSALSLFRRTVLLGPPGAGKSTVARAVASCHVGAVLDPPKEESPQALGMWAAEPLTPVFVELRELVNWPEFPPLDANANAQNLIDFYVERYADGDRRFLSQLISDLQRGKALIILDGLDEVAIPFDVPDALSAVRRQLQSLIRSLGVRFPLCRVIVTSRPAGYSGWTLEDYNVVRLLPLNDHEALELSRRLLNALGYGEAARKTLQSRLKYELGRVPRELREQPLFTTLLLMLFLDTKGDLPRNRAELLEASIGVLLTSWTLPRVGETSLQAYLNCETEQLYDGLAALAFRVHRESSVSPALTDAAEPVLSLGTVLEELFEIGGHINLIKALDFLSNRCGILVSPAPRVYRFAHRLLREYLAASHLSRQPDCSRLVRKLLDGNARAWEEPALLLGDLLLAKRKFGELWGLIDELLTPGTGPRRRWGKARAHLVWLAGRILHEQDSKQFAGAAFERVRRVLRRNLQKVLSPRSELPANRRVEAAEVLASLGDARPGIGLRSGVPDIDWVRVPCGEFEMGTSDEEARSLDALHEGQTWDFGRERPVSLVVVSEFEIGRYPVTNLQYQSFVSAADGFGTDSWWTRPGLQWRLSNSPAPAHDRESRSTCPQTGVTWYEAVAFCNWLSHRAGESIRLPTEPEWEFAARGPEHGVFPWGSAPDASKANVADTGLGRVAPVGCFDMAYRAKTARPAEMIGNVWEWCSTIMQSQDGRVFAYPYLRDEREEPNSDDRWLRVTRGGYHGNIPIVARCAYRGRDLPSARLARQGFRVAREMHE